MGPPQHQSVHRCLPARAAVNGDRPNGLLRRAATVASGAALGQIALLAVAPVLTRWYSPEEFGLFGAFFAASAILGLVATLRLELAIPLPSSDQDAAAVARLADVSVIAIAMVVLAVVTMASDSFLLAPLGVTAWLLAPSALAIGAFNIRTHRAVRHDRFATAGRARVVLGVGTAVTQLALAPLGLGGVGLALGPLVGYVAASLLLSTGAPTTPASGSTMKEQLRRYRRFPLFSVWSALFNRGALELPTIVLLALFGQASAGAFYVAYRITVLPANLLTDSLHQAFLHRGGALARTDAAALASLTRRTVARLAAAAIPVCGLGMLLAPSLVPRVFGAEWDAAGNYARALLPAIGASIVVAPVASIMWITDRQRTELVRNIARFVLVLAAFTLAEARSWGPERTVWAYSAAMVAGQLLLLVFVLHAVSDHERSRTGDSADAPSSPQAIGQP